MPIARGLCGVDASELPEHVLAEAKRILHHEARRLLDEQMARRPRDEADKGVTPTKEISANDDTAVTLLQHDQPRVVPSEATTEVPK
jgi:hypothetical protein